MAGTQGLPAGAILAVPSAIVSYPREIQRRKTETVFLPLEKEMFCCSWVAEPEAEGSH